MVRIIKIWSFEDLRLKFALLLVCLAFVSAVNISYAWQIEESKSLRFIQPSPYTLVLRGTVTFRVEHQYIVAGTIKDVKRTMCLVVMPLFNRQYTFHAWYLMRLVGRTILDSPSHTIFIDTYELKLNTAKFSNDFYLVKAIYQENWEQVESISAVFLFYNSRRDGS